MREVLWRLKQEVLQHREAQKFDKHVVPVTSVRSNYDELKIHSEALHLNLENNHFQLNTSIPLFGVFNYEEYKTDWHAGFNTPRQWEDILSYRIDYRQRDDIGDARINWELNRHFQFALLAKDYCATGDRAYLDELMNLFYDWNAKNSFLHSISWTSVMEVAIRTSNWCFAYCFLDKAKDVPSAFLDGIRRGILTMTQYVVNHHSRFSSANNHLIVEMYVIGVVGLLTKHQPWLDIAVETLTEELTRQNYSDGINKELSLHYQSFYMEAMGLLMRMMTKCGVSVPKEWSSHLSKMSEYVCHCVGEKGEIIEFGDNDEGKLLDLQGTPFNHYEYVLSLMSHLLPMRYVSREHICENLSWLFTEEEHENMLRKPLYDAHRSVCYKEGGNSILYSSDGRVVIGIDHAALGFGTIAAHGHGDALSFVMYVDGSPLFVDPGTYVYHCDLTARNYFRSTANHNTVCVAGRDQSEMLGAFLWGRKANCKLVGSDLTERQQTIEAEHDGYAPIIHRRKFILSESLIIKDTLSENTQAVATLVLHPSVRVEGVSEDKATLMMNKTEVVVRVEGGVVDVEEAYYSPKYGEKTRTKALKIKFHHANVSTKVVWSK